MNTFLAMFLSALIVVAFSEPATADVKVEPLPNVPEISLEGTKIVRSPADPSVPASGPAAGHKPTYTPIVACRTDAELGIYGCHTTDPADPEGDDPELTPADVLRAVREIGLPSLQVRVQPGAETLVNVATIFYAEPQPFERSVSLLGFDVELVAEPSVYQWFHGDGTTATTTDPGRPYPSMDVVHRYAEPAEAVRARVDVTYRVRFRVDGGPWQTIDQTLVAAGPASTLAVDEAAPVLTGS